MPPQPHFERIPHHLEIDEKPDREAENDALFGNNPERMLEELSVAQLFVKRRAHEVHLKMGWRDPAIDTTAIAQITEAYTKKGATDDDYKAFLTTTLESV